jgi:hypothetical protein
MPKHNFETAGSAVYQLLATLTTHNLLEFPGLRELKLKSNDIKGEALAIACVCAQHRSNGEIADRWEGRLEAMHAYDLVDLVELRHYIEDWASTG